MQAELKVAQPMIIESTLIPQSNSVLNTGQAAK